MKTKDWEKVTLSPSHSLADAISILEQGPATRMVLVVGENQELLETITASDIRRALLRGKGLSSSLESVMNCNRTLGPKSNGY
jgi:CBS domain-containing protein